MDICLNLQPSAGHTSLQLLFPKSAAGDADGIHAHSSRPTASPQLPCAAAIRCLHPKSQVTPPHPVPPRHHRSCRSTFPPPRHAFRESHLLPLPPPLLHVFTARASSQDAPRIHDQLRPGHRGEHHNKCQNNARPRAPLLMHARISTSKTGSISHPTHMRLMPRRPSRTPSRPSRRPSGRRGRMQAPLLQPTRRTPPSTSASTRRCSTMPSMATLAHFTLATSTGSPCSCTRCWETPQTRTAQ